MHKHPHPPGFLFFWEFFIRPTAPSGPSTIHLKLKSCLIDGEVVYCDENGAAAFQSLRTAGTSAFLYAFDLLELNGTDLRREPIEVRKATLASILRKSRNGV